MKIHFYQELILLEVPLMNANKAMNGNGGGMV